MSIKHITHSNIETLASIYSSVFSSSPWNEPWNQERAIKRLTHIYESKGFLGLYSEEYGNINGFLLGNIEPFLNGEYYYLREMCVALDRQGEGIGKELMSRLHIELVRMSITRVYLITRKKTLAAKFYLVNGYQLEKEDGVYEIDLNIEHFSRC
ncbi:MAG: GNAT family N-acetyltransferase [Desulfobulbus sp.]|nr:GNAT family N-acetyltransferase [Desulfobulbus sp.]